MANILKLTRLQKTALMRLLDLGATSESLGAPAADDRDLNVMALGRLRRLGLIDSAVVKRAEDHGQYTKYWLTAPGRVEARKWEFVK